MKLLMGAMLAAAATLTITTETASASYCGATRHQRCKSECCCTCQECYTVMKTCREVVHEPVERICYDTVYEEVKETVKVPCTKYIEQTRYRMVEMDCSQPKESCCPRSGCGDASGCCDACAEPEVSFQCEPCIRKMPYTVLVPVPDEKTEEITRVVERKVPRNVTCYIPHVVCKQVPVEICVPVPCCCKESCCEEPGCCEKTCCGDAEGCD